MFCVPVNLRAQLKLSFNISCHPVQLLFTEDDVIEDNKDNPPQSASSSIPLSTSEQPSSASFSSIPLSTQPKKCHPVSDIHSLDVGNCLCSTVHEVPITDQHTHDILKNCWQPSSTFSFPSLLHGKHRRNFSTKWLERYSPWLAYTVCQGILIT